MITQSNKKIERQKCGYLFVSNSSLVAKAPNSNTDIKYKKEVVSVAASVPTGIERCVSFNDADRFEPAMIPVTAGKNRPTSALWKDRKFQNGYKNKVKTINYIYQAAGMCLGSCQGICQHLLLLLHFPKANTIN